MEELDEIVARFEKAVEDLKLAQQGITIEIDYGKRHERWRAEEDEKYWLIDYTAYEDERIWFNLEEFDITDDFYYEIGNYFKTKEEAEQRLEHIKIEQQLKDIALRLNKGVEIDWEDERQAKYCLYSNILSIDREDNLFNDCDYLNKQQGTIYCLDDNFKDTAIKEIGEERLINYLKES